MLGRPLEPRADPLQRQRQRHFRCLCSAMWHQGRRRGSRSGAVRVFEWLAQRCQRVAMLLVSRRCRRRSHPRGRSRSDRDALVTQGVRSQPSCRSDAAQLIPGAFSNQFTAAAAGEMCLDSGARSGPAWARDSGEHTRTGCVMYRRLVLAERWGEVL